MKNNQDWRKCKNCGKYLSYKQLENTKEIEYVFILDTEFSLEESHYKHKNCS